MRLWRAAWWSGLWVWRVTRPEKSERQRGTNYSRPEVTELFTAAYFAGLVKNRDLFVLFSRQNKSVWLLSSVKTPGRANEHTGLCLCELWSVLIWSSVLVWSGLSLGLGTSSRTTVKPAQTEPKPQEQGNGFIDQSLRATQTSTGTFCHFISFLLRFGLNCALYMFMIVFSFRKAILMYFCWIMFFFLEQTRSHVGVISLILVLIFFFSKEKSRH